VEAAGPAAVGCTAEALEAPPTSQHLPCCINRGLLLLWLLLSLLRLLLLLWLLCLLLWATGPCWCICSSCMGRVFATLATVGMRRC
jgi:hypothetical protein